MNAGNYVYFLTLVKVHTVYSVRLEFGGRIWMSIFLMIYTVKVYRGLRGVCRFSLQCLWKRAVRITEKLYTPERERLCML